MENQSTESEYAGATPPATNNLSSNTTLAWRVFLPVFGGVFWSGMVLAFWLIDEEDLYLPYSVWWPRIIFLLLWLGWIYFVRRSLWPLKRIDADDEHIFVTNYWTTARYPWTDVERLEKCRHLGRKAIVLHLKAPGYFGQRILFLSASHFPQWMETHGKQRFLPMDKD